MPEMQGDGRHERRNRGKQHAIKTAARIFSTGELLPSMAYLAEKSDISERTLFRYFGTQDKLIEAVTDHLIPQIVPYFTTQSVEGNLAERIRGLVELRVEYVKKFSSMIRTLESHASRFKEANEIRRGRDILFNDQFIAWLGEDFKKISPETYAVAKTLIELRTLDSLLDEIGDRTAEVVTRSILSLFAADLSG